MLAPERVDLRLDEYRDNSYLTHNLHPYPAKFIPQIPREIMLVLSKPGDWVLDPFCGSGTALVEAKLLGRHAVGVDVNPLSCLIARVKTNVLTPDQLDHAAALTDQIGRHNVQAGNPPPPEFFGRDKWFQPSAQAELASILRIVRSCEEDAVRDVLEVVFSAIVVKASNQESDTRYKAVRKGLRRGDVVRMFVERARDALARLAEFGQISKRTETQVHQMDSTRALPKLSVDLCVTSPPYMNSYDYYLYHKHRMSWLGFDVANTQELEFGSRNKHNDKGLGVDHYNDAIRSNAELVHSAMRKGGYFCIIVGDSILRGDLIKMNANFDEIMSGIGFAKAREIVFPQRKYTRSFTPKLRTVHKDSYVLIYKRS